MRRLGIGGSIGNTIGMLLAASEHGARIRAHIADNPECKCDTCVMHRQRQAYYGRLTAAQKRDVDRKAMLEARKVRRAAQGRR